MNRQQYSVSPFTVFSSFWNKRSLIWQMTRRDVIGRYRGSVMGSGSKTEFAMALNAPLGWKQVSQIEALIKENA